MSRSDYDKKVGINTQGNNEEMNEVKKKVNNLVQFKWILTIVVIIITSMGTFGIWRLFDWTNNELETRLKREIDSKFNKLLNDAENILSTMNSHLNSIESKLGNINNIHDRVASLANKARNMSFITNVISIPTRKNIPFPGNLEHTGRVSFANGAFSDTPIIFTSIESICTEFDRKIAAMDHYEINIENVTKDGFSYRFKVGEALQNDNTRIKWLAIGKSSGR